MKNDIFIRGGNYKKNLNQFALKVLIYLKLEITKNKYYF